MICGWYIQLESCFHVPIIKAPLQALSPASQVRTLTHITVTEGFEQDRHQMQCLFIGIDARCVRFTT